MVNHSSSRSTLVSFIFGRFSRDWLNSGDPKFASP